MGIIGSIRKHSGWAVAIVGIAILAFILGDLTKNGNKIPDVGKVNGETMTSQRWTERVNELEESYKLQQQTLQVPAEMESQIREQVWQQFVDETLLGAETKALGLKVTSAELSDMYTGEFIHPYVRQSFTDPTTGQFDLQQINYWIENFDQIDSTRRLQWSELEKYVRADREQQKYSTLIASGFYMPSTLAEMVVGYSKNVSNVKVVALPFSMLPDEEVAATDADYKEYYNKHKAEFRVREEMRDIEFITFPVLPTAGDLADIENQVNKVWDEFQTTPDEEIPFFVNAESDTRYDSNYVKAASFGDPLESRIASASDGDLIEPMMVNGQWVMAKVMKTGLRPDSLRASVVYILNNTAGGSISRNNEQAKLLADSVLNLIKTNKMSFEQAVEQFSDDPQKSETHGDMDWQRDGGYGFLNESLIQYPVGSSFLFEHPQGVGYFIVKVTDKTPASKKYRVALVTREIVASNTTNRAVFTEANRFAGQNRTLAELESAAQQQNMQVRSARLTMMADDIAGISNARNIVQWAFNEKTKVGEVADQVYDCNGTFVVVTLKDVFKKGYATLPQVRTMIEQPVLLDKKADVLYARANEAISTVKDIASIAVKLNTIVDTIDSVAINDYYLGRYGMEPKVLATIATSKPGLVGPVKGASGIYVIQIDGTAPREVAVDNTTRQLEQGYRSKSRMLTAALRDNAKIEDHRNKFF